MNEILNVVENGIQLVIEQSPEGDVWFRHLSPLAYDAGAIEKVDDVKYRLCEVQAAGFNQDDHHGSRHTGTLPGRLLRYMGHLDERNQWGRHIAVRMQGGGIETCSHLQFFDGISVVRSHTEVRNVSSESIGIEYVSSFSLTGLTKEDPGDWEKHARISLCYNAWYSELQWRTCSLPELGLSHTNWASTQRIVKSVTGTWPTGETMPMGFFENTATKAGWLWQIEANGSWIFEIADLAKTLYLQLSGPSFQENGWCKRLPPGETFSTVSAAIAPTQEGIQAALQEMTKYRRRMLRKAPADAALPVIYNDAIAFDLAATEEKLMSYIPLAEQIGCEAFCIDAGWYAREDWWSEAGYWFESRERFPGGIRRVTDAIRSYGMIPGLWLEPEEIGMKGSGGESAPLPGGAREREASEASQGTPGIPEGVELPEDWFFWRNGKRVMDHGRYQLDMRNPEVVRFMDETVDRCVSEYGASYLKIDYNINAGAGTELKSDSLGDGLLEHNRAYLKWLEKLFDRHPDLIIENCASGGQRMDFATMRLSAMASITDQGDVYELCRIGAAAPSALPPEQCGMWICPEPGDDGEKTVFAMINAMLMRMHLSIKLDQTPEEQCALIKAGIAVYQSIRTEIPAAIPFWPLGLPKREDGYVALGLQTGKGAYLALWRLDGMKNEVLLPGVRGKQAAILFPEGEGYGGSCQWGEEGLVVSLPRPYCARLIAIT